MGDIDAFWDWAQSGQPEPDGVQGLGSGPPAIRVKTSMSLE